jgi:hypothetical protein
VRDDLLGQGSEVFWRERPIHIGLFGPAAAQRASSLALFLERHAATARPASLNIASGVSGILNKEKVAVLRTVLGPFLPGGALAPGAPGLPPGPYAPPTRVDLTNVITFLNADEADRMRDFIAALPGDLIRGQSGLLESAPARALRATLA